MMVRLFSPFENTAPNFRVGVGGKVIGMKYCVGKGRKFEGNFGQLDIPKPYRADGS
jgi:hypothetical protein